jgi:opacity protein-like surface antigen
VRTLAAVALLLAGALPSAAGELAVEAQVGYFDMAAKDSAQALFGSSGGVTFGGAVRYTAWRGAFVSAGFRTFSKDGERVFLLSPGGTIQKLGFPVSVELRPILLMAGYRFRNGELVVPYAAIGAALTSYTETSTVAGESFDSDGSKTGFVGAAGVEVGRGMFRVGAEFGYSTVSGASGLGGVSKIYGEDDIGGFHVIGKVAVAFGLGGQPKPAPKPKPATPKP